MAGRSLKAFVSLSFLKSYSRLFLCSLTVCSLLLIRDVLGRGNIGVSVESMQCAQIKPLWIWSAEHYGGRELPDPRSDAFSKRVTEQFLLKLDPHRFLFLQSEEAQLSAKASANWRAVLDARSCTAFQQFYDISFAKAETRLLEYLSRWRYLAPKSEMASGTAQTTESVTERDLPKFAARARDISEYESRLNTVFSEIVSNASPYLVRAYGGDHRALVKDHIQETFFSDARSARLALLLSKAMLGAVDKYSTFFAMDEFEDFYQDLAGTVTGIGIRVAKSPRGFLITKVLPGSPAQSQIKVGDTIIGIDGNLVLGKTLDEGRSLLKGAENTWMSLSLKREGVASPITVRVLRKIFSADDAKVTSRWLTVGGKPGALILQVPSFYGRGGIDSAKDERSAAEDVESELKRSLRNKADSAPVILDLRGNPGGYLEEAISMAGLFLGNKVVSGVVEKSNRRVLRSTRLMPLYRGPLVVWLDEESASAAEVLAGALKDYGRALIVGEGGSYGKGSVQRLFHLGDDLPFFSERGEAIPPGVVKLTTSYFFSPLGHNPSNGGVLPHVKMACQEKHRRSLVEGKPKVADTSSFLTDSETHTLQTRDRRVREIVHELLQRAEVTVPPGNTSEEMAVARYGKLYAELQQSE